LTVRLKAEGDALAAQGDYEGAALKYQQAANQEPEDVSIRFALGSALSHLNRREETVEQFRFVVARGKPDSTEVQAARRWLVAAGEAADAVTFAPSAASGETVAAPSGSPPRPPAFDLPPGKVRGKIEARGREGREVNLALIGDEEWNTSMAIPLTARLGQAFEFDGVAPGNYRLTAEDRETGEELWDVPVTVTAGKEIVVDLK
jgi:tetratricopeptide (TPR) repeat protein